MSERRSGLINLKSNYSLSETLARLSAKIRAAGLVEFARVDHGANAVAAGLVLRPTVLVIFGNAKGGTPLMVDQQTCGIDLPLKALCWEDDGGRVWLSYNDPAWVATRHGLSGSSAAAVAALAKALPNLMAAVSS